MPNFTFTDFSTSQTGGKTVYILNCSSNHEEVSPEIFQLLITNFIASALNTVAFKDPIHGDECSLSFSCHCSPSEFDGIQDTIIQQFRSIYKFYHVSIGIPQEKIPPSSADIAPGQIAVSLHQNQPTPGHFKLTITLTNISLVKPLISPFHAARRFTASREKVEPSHLLVSASSIIPTHQEPLSPAVQASEFLDDNSEMKQYKFIASSRHLPRSRKKGRGSTRPTGQTITGLDRQSIILALLPVLHSIVARGMPNEVIRFFVGAHDDGSYLWNSKHALSPSECRQINDAFLGSFLTGSQPTPSRGIYFRVPAKLKLSTRILSKNNKHCCEVSISFDGKGWPHPPIPLACSSPFRGLLPAACPDLLGVGELLPVLEGGDMQYRDRIDLCAQKSVVTVLRVLPGSPHHQPEADPGDPYDLRLVDTEEELPEGGVRFNRLAGGIYRTCPYITEEELSWLRMRFPDCVFDLHDDADVYETEDDTRLAVFHDTSFTVVYLSPSIIEHVSFLSASFPEPEGDREELRHFVERGRFSTVVGGLPPLIVRRPCDSHRGEGRVSFLNASHLSGATSTLLHQGFDQYDLTVAVWDSLGDGELTQLVSTLHTTACACGFRFLLVAEDRTSFLLHQCQELIGDLTVTGHGLFVVVVTDSPGVPKMSHLIPNIGTRSDHRRPILELGSLYGDAVVDTFERMLSELNGMKRPLNDACLLPFLATARKHTLHESQGSDPEPVWVSDVAMELSNLFSRFPDEPCLQLVRALFAVSILDSVSLRVPEMCSALRTKLEEESLEWLGSLFISTDDTISIPFDISSIFSSLDERIEALERFSGALVPTRQITAQCMETLLGVFVCASKAKSDSQVSPLIRVFGKDPSTTKSRLNVLLTNVAPSHSSHNMSELMRTFRVLGQPGSSLDVLQKGMRCMEAEISALPRALLSHIAHECVLTLDMALMDRTVRIATELDGILTSSVGFVILARGDSFSIRAFEAVFALCQKISSVPSDLPQLRMALNSFALPWVFVEQMFKHHISKIWKHLVLSQIWNNSDDMIEFFNEPVEDLFEQNEDLERFGLPEAQRRWLCKVWTKRKM
eukprot:gnl/Dysnectes_brevis/6282_a9637_359.p1 GENE.gnl/Dysnectes_brevis/6282_a9637_359~~gnl/Dysnectes_brevis/6282_a9637_359.p1  ORF type:complete len:1079 (-),score=118.75 gnl/Dysnectes_brevis/6282_a9637_359:34-3270(-)